MQRVRCIAIVQVILLLAGLSGSWAQSGPDKKTADHFAVTWSSIRYNKAVVLHNPAVASAGQEVSESLALSCEIEVRDPNLVLGICRDGVVTQLTDSQGRNIDVNLPPQRSTPFYGGLRSRPRFQQPPKPPRWRTLVRSIVKLPQDTPTRPQLVTELQPSRLELRLDMGLLGQPGKEVRHIKGYFHALMAESLDHIEVPFEPNDTWVRLAPDLEIQVREADCTGSSFRFRIETRPKGGGSMGPLRVGGFLPGRIAVGRQFIGEDGKPTRHFGGALRVPGPVGGSGSGSGGTSRIKAIRFIVAVNPTHRQVPFELAHIPLPNPAQPAAAPDGE